MSNKRTAFDYIADLMSGRLQNSIKALHRNQRVLQAQINDLQNKEIFMTANEQKILDAAQALKTAATEISEGVQALKDRIATLEGVEPENLSEEFAVLDDALLPLMQLGDSLAPSPAGTPADGGTTAPADSGTPDITGPGITEPATPTPLAGDSGTTNPTPDSATPLVEQSQPGTDFQTSTPETTPAPEPETEETATQPEEVPVDASSVDTETVADTADSTQEPNTEAETAGEPDASLWQ